MLIPIGCGVQPTPDDVVKALAAGNAIVPAGNLYVKDEMPLVPTNATVVDIGQFGDIPLQPGRDVYLHDVATIADATDVNFGYRSWTAAARFTSRLSRKTPPRR